MKKTIDDLKSKISSEEISQLQKKYGYLELNDNQFFHYMEIALGNLVEEEISSKDELKRELDFNLENLLLDRIVTQDEETTDNQIKMYLREIGRYRVLSKEEEYELFKSLEQCEDVRDILIKHNLKLAYIVAKKFFRRGYDHMDLIQEANYHLIESIASFDCDRQNRFSTYAYRRIWGKLLRYLDQNEQDYHIPIDVRNKLRKIAKAVSSCKSQTGVTPTLEELASKTKLDVSVVKNLFPYLKGTVRLDAPLDEKGKLYSDILIDFNQNQESYEHIEVEELSNKLSELLDKCLTEREALVLKKRFGMNEEQEQLTNEKLAEELNITPPRVRQIEAQALYRLRKTPKIDSYAVYLDEPDRGLERVKEVRKVPHERRTYLSKKI